jgi:hypothetical protein
MENLTLRNRGGYPESAKIADTNIAKERTHQFNLVSIC